MSEKLEQKLTSPDARIYLSKRRQVIEAQGIGEEERTQKLKKLNAAYLRVAKLGADDAFIQYLKAVKEADSIEVRTTSQKAPEERPSKKKGFLRGLFSKRDRIRELSTNREEKPAAAQIIRVKEIKNPSANLLAEKLRKLDPSYDHESIAKLVNAGILNKSEPESSIEALAQKTYSQGYKLLLLDTETRKKIAEKAVIPVNQLGIYLRGLPKDYILAIGKGQGKIVYYSKHSIDEIVHVLSGRRKVKKSDGVQAENKKKQERKAELPTTVTPSKPTAERLATMLAPSPDLTKKPVPLAAPNVYFEDCGSICLKQEDAFKLLCQMSPLYTPEVFQRLLMGVLEKNNNDHITRSSFSALEAKTKGYSPFILTREQVEINLYRIRTQDGTQPGRIIITKEAFNKQVLGALHTDKTLLTIGRGENIVSYLSQQASDQPIDYLKSRTLLEANLLPNLSKTQTVTCFNIMLKKKIDGKIIPWESFDRIVTDIEPVRIMLNGNKGGPYERTKVRSAISNLLNNPTSEHIQAIKEHYSVAPENNAGEARTS